MYRTTVGLKSLHATKFKPLQINYLDESNENALAHLFEKSVEHAGYVIRLVEQVRKLKTEKQLSLKTALEQLTVIANEMQVSALREQQELIKGVTQAKSILFLTASDTKTSMYQENDVWHAVVELSL